MNQTATTTVNYRWVEELDRMGRPYERCIFEDQGVILESWQVALPEFLAAYQSRNPYATMAHCISVARALNHGLPVLRTVSDSHNLADLEAMCERESRLHGDMPNTHCALCNLEGNR